MKIFLVCNSLGGGGAERVHVNLANGFAQRRHDVFLIADLNQSATYPVDEKVHLLPLCPSVANKLKKWGGEVMMLRKYIKRFNPDVVIGNMHLCSVLSRLAVTGTKTPVVMTIHHALETKDYEHSKITQILDRWSPSFYAATTVLTGADAEVMAERYRQMNIYVMPNPLTFSPVTIGVDGLMRNETGEVLQKQNVILAAGRLAAWRHKGWDFLMQVAGKIRPLLLREGWKIKIAGSGSTENLHFLQDLCLKAGAGDVVEFLGYRTDMKELFQEASIFLLSSRSEGLPMVLIEAMSQGCAPVACENLGRTQEIITNSNEGLLYKTADVDDMTEKLSLMVMDENYRMRVQLRSVERSAYYKIDHIVDMWEEMLKNII